MPPDYLGSICSGSGQLTKYLVSIFQTLISVIPNCWTKSSRKRDRTGSFSPPLIQMSMAARPVLILLSRRNCRGALNVAAAAKQYGSRLMFMSTDYVFDGAKSTPYETGDRRNPQSVYGRSKAQAAEGIERVLPNCCILRTSWLFGSGGKCFPDTILKLSATRPELEVVNYQRGCPTYARDLHVRSFSFAGGILKGSFTSPIVAIAHGLSSLQKSWGWQGERPSSGRRRARNSTDPRKRPKYSVLSDKSMEQHNIYMPTWQEAIRDCLAEKDLYGESCSRARVF